MAFVYWVGIALGALILLGALHAAKARWPVVLRRFLETIPQTLPLFAVLFVPIALGMRHLFSWVDPSGATGELLHAIQHKRPYLNVPFFLARAAVYFAVWIAVATLLRALERAAGRRGRRTSSPPGSAGSAPARCPSWR